MSDDLFPPARRLVPYLEMSFVIATSAAVAVAALAKLGPRGDQITEVTSCLMLCATVWIVLRRDVCHWVNSRLAPTTAGAILAPLGIVLLTAAAYTIATNRVPPAAPVQIVLKPAPPQYV